MKGATRIQWMVVALAVMGMCCPQLAWAASQQETPASTVADVQLREGGVLLGQVVTPENVAVAQTGVSIQTGGQVLATAETDANGYFAFKGLSNGVYQVAAGEHQVAYRLWNGRTAPPSAQHGAMIVTGKQTVRGQFSGLRNALANPLVVAGIVAAAVAIPVAIHNADDGPSSP